MSEGAGAAEWMAFLSPFSEASLNRFVTGPLGLGTGQDGAGSGVEIPDERPACLTRPKPPCVCLEIRQPARCCVIGGRKSPGKVFVAAGGEAGMGYLRARTHQLCRGAKRRPAAARHQPPPSNPFVSGLDFFHLQRKKILFTSFSPYKINIKFLFYKISSYKIGWGRLERDYTWPAPKEPS